MREWVRMGILIKVENLTRGVLFTENSTWNSEDLIAKESKSLEMQSFIWQQELWLKHLHGLCSEAAQIHINYGVKWIITSFFYQIIKPHGSVCDLRAEWLQLQENNELLSLLLTLWLWRWWQCSWCVCVCVHVCVCMCVFVLLLYACSPAMHGEYQVSTNLIRANQMYMICINSGVSPYTGSQSTCPSPDVLWCLHVCVFLCGNDDVGT